MNRKHPEAKMLNVDVSECENAPYPFAVNSDLCVIRKSVTLQLGYLPDRLHVGRVAPSTKNYSNLGFRIDVGRSDQCSCGIARESNKVYRDALASLLAGQRQSDSLETHLSLQGCTEHPRHVVPFCVWRAETFGPANEGSMVYPLLPG